MGRRRLRLDILRRESFTNIGPSWFSVDPIETNQTIYQYDGTWSDRNLTAGLEEGSDPSLAKSITFANAFTAEEAGSLSSVSFWTGEKNLDWKVEVYTGLPVEDDPTKGELVATVVGGAPYEGYHMVDLEETVPLDKGKHFSVVVTLSFQDEVSNRLRTPRVSVDLGYPNGDITFTDSSKAGQSYLLDINKDGSISWLDLGDPQGEADGFASNVRVKAFVDKVDTPAATDLRTATVGAAPVQEYTGSAIEPSFEVKLEGKLLTESADYQVSYHDNVSTGQGGATIAGIGNYTGTKETEFTIAGIDIRKAEVVPIPDQVLHELPILPKITLTYEGETLVEGVDYRISDKSDFPFDVVGIGGANIEGMGRFSDVKNVTYNIVAEEDVPIEAKQVCALPETPEGTAESGTLVSSSDKLFYASSRGRYLFEYSEADTAWTQLAAPMPDEDTATDIRYETLDGTLYAFFAVIGDAGTISLRGMAYDRLADAWSAPFVVTDTQDCHQFRKD